MVLTFCVVLWDQYSGFTELIWGQCDWAILSVISHRHLQFISQWYSRELLQDVRLPWRRTEILIKDTRIQQKTEVNTLSFVIHQSLCIIPLQVIISKKAFLSFRPWISLAWDPSSERLNSDSLRLTRNLLFSLSKLVTLATTVWPMSKTVEVSVTNWSPMAYDEKQNQIYTKMYNFIQNPIQTTKTKTYSFRSEAEEPIREIDEDSIRHDVLHPADHLHPPLELREVFGDAVVLQTGLQQRFLSESLNRTRLRRTERCGSLSTWLHRYYLNWTELDNNITESMMSWL